MIDRLIEFSLKGKFVIVILGIGVAGWSLWVMLRAYINASPDLSDNQVIALTEWQDRSPQEVESKIAYPLTVNLDGLPGVKVRSLQDWYVRYQISWERHRLFAPRFDCMNKPFVFALLVPVLLIISAYGRASVRRLLLCLGLFVQIALPTQSFGQTSVQPGKFGWKPSGFENLVVGGASEGRGGEAGGSSESEVELTPQYKAKSGTVIAARGVLNLQAASNASGISSAWNLTVPELSLFAIGGFGRIEIGDRSGFPQSLIGFTPSEIAFTSAEFGPESGERLDPNGGLPTVFLPHPLADRMNDLTYLGYAERFYSDRSLKLIYVTPRSRTGFYGAISYTPATDISTGFNLNGDTRTPDTGLRDEGNPGVFRNITQTALVWTHRTQNIDVSAGSTYSYATASAGNPIVRDSNSLSEGITATLHDAWTFGLSGTYDGFSRQRRTTPPGQSPVSPYGVVASANYVEGPWTFGGYYQHATADSITAQPSRDTVNIGEAGVARLIDRNHDLLGAGFYTDIKLFASLYYYRFHGAEPSNIGADQNGAVLLFGARFSFF